MGRRTSTHRHGAGPRDLGATFIEMLVSIVLLGTVVVGSLTALRATIIATEIDADHANAYTWLQSAADAIDDAAYVGCDTASNNTIVAAYQAAANAASRRRSGPRPAPR